jgi:hypothetical protein
MCTNLQLLAELCRWGPLYKRMQPWHAVLGFVSFFVAALRSLIAAALLLLLLLRAR